MTTKRQLQARLAEAEAQIARFRAREGASIQYPNDAARAVAGACAYHEQETFVAVYMDARQKILHTTVVSVGTLASVEVHPREVFRDAVRLAAHSIILGHNHPSGDTTPSDADLVLTKRMVDAGKLMGIPVLDHVIVADGQAPYSFAAAGAM